MIQTTWTKCIVLFIFCFRLLTQGPFFLWANSYAQNEEIPLPEEVNYVWNTLENSMDINTADEVNDTIIVVAQDDLQTWITEPIDTLPSYTTSGDEDTKNTWTLILDTITTNILNNIPLIQTEDVAPDAEQITSVIQTTYETWVLSWTTEQYTEEVTILQKQQLTVSIPENTLIQTKQGEQKAIKDLVLTPWTWEEIVSGWEQNELSVTTSHQGSVMIDETQYIIPEFASATDTQKINLSESILSSWSALWNDDSKEDLQEVFAFGIPQQHLIFSEPITISYIVPFSEGSLVELHVQHAWEAAAWTQWLSTDNSVTCNGDWSASTGWNIAEVKWWQVTFFTCGASTFTITYTWWASSPNFVDNWTKDFTVTVVTGSSFPTWSVLNDVNILVNFRPIDNESATGPRGTTNCYPAEKSFLLIHPDGTQVQLANAWTYTTPNTNCPQAQILYDQSASSWIVWWAWNLTWQSRQPVGNLSTLNGKSPFGIRTLRMGDSTAQDGVILFWFDLTLKNVECGDGLIWTGEQCDDTNAINGDGCNTSCQLEAWRTCTWEPSSCTPIPAPSGLQVQYDWSFSWWLFTDISGNWYHWTRFNTVTTGTQNGETIMCFNGTNQYIERTTNLATSYPITMSAWIKSDTTSWLHGVMSFARSTSTNIMRNLEHNATTMRASAQNTTARYANGTTTLNTTQWFLVTAVYNWNNSRDIYINGVYEGTNTQAANYSSNNNNRLNIGRFADSSPGNYFDWCLDDIRFYTTALTSWQIYTIYAKPAALSTSYTTSSSPQLTWTIQWPLDTITITVSGTTYTWVNNWVGWWSLSWWIISPGLTSWTYPTTLTVTNPYGRSVTYNSSFIVNIPPAPSWDFCIAGPSNISFQQITTESYAQTWFTSSSGYFQLIDSSGADSWYYTTLQITSLSWTMTSLTNTWIARQSTGIVLLSWTANTWVILWSAFSSYSIATGTVTFIKRDPAPNTSKKWTYGAILQLRLSLPAYIKPDTYTGTITYTLYEN